MVVSGAGVARFTRSLRSSTPEIVMSAMSAWNTSRVFSTQISSKQLLPTLALARRPLMGTVVVPDVAVPSVAAGKLKTTGSLWLVQAGEFWMIEPTTAAALETSLLSGRSQLIGL